jgi:hypothetical protein
MAGAASGGDVTVRNLTPGGALLATVPAAGRHHFQFDGTNWAPIT